jgi:hypothetical protein
MARLPQRRNLNVFFLANSAQERQSAEMFGLIIGAMNKICHVQHLIILYYLLGGAIFWWRKWRSGENSYFSIS